MQELQHPPKKTHSASHRSVDTYTERLHPMHRLFRHRFNTRPVLRLASFTALFVLLLVAGCAQPEEANTPTTAEASETPEQRQVRIETIVLRLSSFEDVIELTGTVEAYNDATVSAQISGTLERRAPRGSNVGRNSVIAIVDSTAMYASYLQGRAQLDLAQAQYDLAADTYSRQEPLFQDSIISALEFETVRAQYNQAAAQLSQAKAGVTQLRDQLDHARVTAPFGGTIETYFAEVGEQVAPGMPIVRIVNTRRVKVVAGVPERYANDIETGDRVRVAFDTYGASERTGTVSFAGRAINRGNRTFPIEILMENQDLALKPEMVASVFLTRDEIKEVLVVPQSALPLDETGHSVFVVVERDGQQIAERRRIDLGPSYAGMVVVESGLEAGDEIVVNGQYNLTEGDAVEVVNANDSPGSNSVAVIEPVR